MERDDSKWPHARWCDEHKQYHGIAYVCATYSDELKAEIITKTEKFLANLRDPEWCRKQIEDGVPGEAITAFKIFAGVEDG